MSNYTDNLWRDLVREHGATLALSDRPEPTRARRPRPRVLAGGTLGLAGAGAAVVLALSGSAAAPAFAVTTGADGTVTVTLNKDSALTQANAKLASMGIHERIGIQEASGAATVSGSVTCTPKAGVTGPAVKVLQGNDGTEVTSSGNTGAGTWHLATCAVFNPADSGSTAGNTGVTYGTPGTLTTKPLPAGTVQPVG
jgi:hypothetical protein